MASPPSADDTDEKTLPRRSRSFHSKTNSVSEPATRSSSRRSSSLSRSGSQETPTSDADQAEWGPMIKKVPLSTHLRQNKLDTETNIDNLIFTFSRQRFLTQSHNRWRSPYYDDLKSLTDDDDDDDETVNPFEEKSFDFIQKILATNALSVFKFFEDLARENGTLGARIAESCLIGLQRSMDETGQWRWL